MYMLKKICTLLSDSAFFCDRYKAQRSVAARVQRATQSLVKHTSAFGQSRGLFGIFALVPCLLGAIAGFRAYLERNLQSLWGTAAVFNC
jgi:hypothetical protein